PLSFSKRQLPPTSEPFSKQSNSTPRLCSTWHAVSPDEPAPMMQTFPSPVIPANLSMGCQLPNSSARPMHPEIERSTVVAALGRAIRVPLQQPNRCVGTRYSTPLTVPPIRAQRQRPEPAPVQVASACCMSPPSELPSAFELTPNSVAGRNIAT